MNASAQPNSNRPRWLAGSLGLNLLLLVVIVWAKGQPPADAPQAAPATTPAQITMASATTAPEADVILTNEVTAPFHWSDVESTDYLQYLTNLQAIGCPDQRIRDILIADVDALFAGRARDYLTPLQGQFWALVSRPDELETTIASHQEFLDALDQEREAIFRALFNAEDPRRQTRQLQRELRQKARQDALLGFLDARKRATVEALQAELNQAMSNLKTPESLTNRNDIRRHRETQQRELSAATDQKLRAVLSPEEFEEYSLRHSPAAQVRYRLARMTVSESEARRLAQVDAGKNEAERQFEPKDPATKAARAELEQRTQDQIKTILGPERYHEYQRVTDNRYNETARVIDRLQLPEATAVSIYQGLLEAEKIAARLRANSSASAEERNAALNAIRAEAESSVRQQLGESAFKDYQNHAGAWFFRLSEPVK
jgi:hypothetical protein